MVTSKGVGLAVPDWPTTFGYNMFMFPVSKWIGGIFFEHTHRLIASVVGFMTIILAVWMRLAERRRWLRNLAYLALLAVVLQGVLGGLRVTMLKDEIGIFHACLAQAFLGLLVFIAIATSNFWQSLGNEAVDRARLRGIRFLAIFTTIVIYVQLGLGATMRHQHRDLSILDFPTAYRQWIPDTSPDAIARINAWRDARALSDVTAFQIWLQMIHRLVAVVIALGVVAVAVKIRQLQKFLRAPVLSRLSILWVVLVFCQIALGAWVIWSNKAADIATSHVAMGALMLSFGVSICAIIWRIDRSQTGARSTVSPVERPMAA